MENNNVFVDNQGNFYTVLNDNDFSYFELQLLQEEGFYFAYETLSSEGKENFTWWNKIFTTRKSSNTTGNTRSKS